MPTLAELRAQSGPKPLPRAERTVSLIEGQHLIADAQKLSEERDDLMLAARRTDDDGNATKPPAKAGQGAAETRKRNARLTDIGAELAMISGRLGEHQGVIGLTGIEGGDWQRFKDANPPREGNDADERLAGGFCNFTAVFETLGAYVSQWNGEDVPEGEWDSMLAERIIYADRCDMVTTVVLMHEQGLLRAPKSPSSSSSTKDSATD